MRRILGIILILIFVFSGVMVFAEEVLTINGEEIKVCAHTIDSKDRSLNSYNYIKNRFLKIN